MLFLRATGKANQDADKERRASSLFGFIASTFLIPVCTAPLPTTADPQPFSARWGPFTEHLHSPRVLQPRPDVCDSSNGYEPLWLEHEPLCFYSSLLLPHILFCFFQISCFLWSQKKALLVETGQRCRLPCGAQGIALPFGDNSDRYSFRHVNPHIRRVLFTFTAHIFWIFSAVEAYSLSKPWCKSCLSWFLQDRS